MNSEQIEKLRELRQDIGTAAAGVRGRDIRTHARWMRSLIDILTPEEQIDGVTITSEIEDGGYENFTARYGTLRGDGPSPGEAVWALGITMKEEEGK